MCRAGLSSEPKAIQKAPLARVRKLTIMVECRLLPSEGSQQKHAKHASRPNLVLTMSKGLIRPLHMGDRGFTAQCSIRMEHDTRAD